uniref:Uncharacterized protein n=1 Tax=Trichogramma kaykai TaxID=54128 RepID=A0ABD2X390_9HYME
MSDDPLGIKNLLLNDLDLCGNNFYLQDMVDNENIFFSTNLEDDGNSLGKQTSITIKKICSLIPFYLNKK